MTRKRTPDIMGDLLESADKTPKQPDGVPEEQQDSETASPLAGTTVGQQTGQTVKATFYLDSSTTLALDYAWLQLRALAGRKISRSGIVEAALRAALIDLQKRGPESLLASILAKR